MNRLASFCNQTAFDEGSATPATLLSAQHQRQKTGKNSEDKDPMSFVSEAMGQLSMEEREQAFFELHGVRKEENSSPDCITEEQLEEMYRHVSRLVQEPSFATPGYELALKRNPDFARNKKLWARFIFGKHEDCKSAAEVFLRYLDLKLFLWGEERICKDITWDDLSEEDRSLSKKGYFQRLPARDRSGRYVGVQFFQTFDAWPSPRAMVGTSIRQLSRSCMALHL